MVDGEDGEVIADRKRLAMSLANFDLREEVTKRMPAEWHDHARLNQCNLELQPRHALLFLFWGRISVLWWLELHDIRDVDLLTPETNRCHKFIEILSCRTNERTLEFILSLSGGFSDEQNLGMWITFTKDRLRGLRQITTFPRGEFLTEDVEREVH
jgi:hypothetical protein